MAEEHEQRLVAVLAAEYKALHGAPPKDNDLGSLPKIHEAIHGLRARQPAEPRTALCLSGGGIRSASFALGVLQAFAEKELLERFHYLSTVSGGGYIGGWLTAWRRAHSEDLKNGRPGTDPMTGLNERVGGLGREPEEIRGLRSFSNYLTPKLGLLSADTWALAALYLRNLLLNWVVYLPLIVAVILTPILVHSIQHAAAIHESSLWYRICLGASAAALVLALCTSVWGRQGENPKGGSAVAYMLSRATSVLRPQGRGPKYRATQGWFLLLGLLPIYVAAMLICIYSMGAKRSDAWLGGVTIVLGSIVMTILYAVAWFAVVPRAEWRQKWMEIGSWAIAGAIAGALIAWGIEIANDLVRPPGPHLATDEDLRGIPSGTPPNGLGFEKGTRLLVIFGIGWVASAMFIGEAIYLGLTSRLLKGDADREWLARSSGWFLALTIVWGLLSALVLFAPEIRSKLEGLFWALIPVGAGAGAVAAGIGSSAKTLASLLDRKGGESVSMTTVLAVAAVVFLVAMTIFLGKSIDVVLAWWIGLLGQSPRESPDLGTIGVIALAIGLCLGFVALASVPINVNRFSSHALYRNRLTRAFLGSARGNAGQTSATRDSMTGFDARDNLPMSALATPAERPRLFHVVNMALNVVSGKNTAWQERKAEPFIVTPQVAGNEYVGFHPSATYGKGLTEEGITLGTCMAISGAAASPNQGYHSSPLVGLIMTLFNVRLGWWLGNPTGPDAARAGPRWGFIQVIKEMFGLTDDRSRYVYLSDGGHFENLGLYEMVRRRCHMIVVSDGGADPDCAFEDLGNAVRKIWIDLGVRIEFKRIEIRKRGIEKDALYCALGRIYYPEEKDPKNAGFVLYIKPSFHNDGTEPPDVCAYALANLTFPHETTGDQFFSESQLESYRSLGKFITDTILGKKTTDLDKDAPTVALQPYWKHLSKYIEQFEKQAAIRD